jgi:hypothetical protein
LGHDERRRCPFFLTGLRPSFVLPNDWFSDEGEMRMEAVLLELLHRLEAIETAHPDLMNK